MSDRGPSRNVRVDISSGVVAAQIADGDDPPVVLVAQIGTRGASWQPVADLLTTGSTVVTYDRPGIGASPSRPAPNLPLPYSGFATELATMLDQLDITQSVVIVGHSVGSVIVRAFAVAHPERVAGVVHVDGSWPGLDLGPWTGPHVDGDGPNCTEFDTARGATEITGIAWPVIPGAVLVRSPGRWDGSTPFDPEVDRFWHEQAAQLAVSLGVPRVIAVDAGHQMVREAPSLVAYAIDEVVRAVREGHLHVLRDGVAVRRRGGRLVSDGLGGEAGDVDG